MTPVLARSIAVIGVLLASASGPSLAQNASSFDLVCDGVGQKLESQYDYAWDYKHHEYKPEARLGTAQVGGAVQVEIHGDDARIRLPKSLLPPLNGSSDGWFPIRDLSIDEGQIRGSVKLNGLNKPKFSIDRATGRFNLDGSESFEGRCNAYNPGANRF